MAGIITYNPRFYSLQVSILMTACTIVSILTVLISGLSDWNSGSRGYAVASSVVGARGATKVPVEVHVTM